ncbi:MAG: hypothetical protein NVSMB55_27260 [Mycobacteriales bacterium]
MTSALQHADPRQASSSAIAHRLAALSEAVSAVRSIDLQASSALSQAAAAPPRDGFSALFEAELRGALRDGQAASAFDAADALWRRTDDLHRVYRVLLAALAAASAERRCGASTLVQERRTVTAAASVIARLRARRPAPAGPDTVLVIAPDPEPAGLVLEVVAHLVEDAGLPALAITGAPVEELAEALGQTAVTAVVVSVSTPAGAASLRSLLATLQRAAPDVPRLLTGPAAPAAVSAASVVARDVRDLIDFLAAVRSPLTAREAKVLACVADGLTNAEAGARLGIAPATVKSHLDNIYDKTATQHRAAAVAIALRHGWLR